MKLGLNRWDWRSAGGFAAEVAEAEHIGIDYAFLPVNPLGVADPYVLMAAGLQATNSMTFGPLLETPVLRPPAVAAGSIATVEGLSPGRSLLTYGVGDTAVRWLGKRPARVAELEQATIEARALLAGDKLDVGAASPAWLRHARPVPVWLAAGGPKTLRMAGRVADGIFLRVGTHEANLRAAMTAIAAGATEAGRDPNEIDIAIIVHTAATQDPRKIRAISRAMAAGFFEYSPALFEAPDFVWNGPDIEQLKSQIWPDFHHASDLVAAGALVDFLSDEVARSFCFCGDPADIADQLRAVMTVVPQASIVVPHPAPTPQFGQSVAYAKWFVDDVIPHL